MKVKFKQRPGENHSGSHADIWGKSVPSILCLKVKEKKKVCSSQSKKQPPKCLGNSQEARVAAAEQMRGRWWVSSER